MTAADTPVGSPPGRLGQAELDRIFAEQIRPTLTGPAREHPTAIFIAGQPGVGKTIAQATMVARLGPSNVVSLDGDDHVLAHPHYEALARADDRTAMVNPSRVTPCDIGRQSDVLKSSQSE